jgi:hypothetical protein
MCYAVETLIYFKFNYLNHSNFNVLFSYSSFWLHVPIPLPIAIGTPSLLRKEGGYIIVIQFTPPSLRQQRGGLGG